MHQELFHYFLSFMNIYTSVIPDVTFILNFFLFEFPCIISLYYVKNQQDATLTVLFISHCKITLHVSDAFCVHHQEY